jgi:hypothetical protein
LPFTLPGSLESVFAPDERYREGGKDGDRGRPTGKWTAMIWQGWRPVTASAGRPATGGPQLAAQHQRHQDDLGSKLGR